MENNKRIEITAEDFGLSEYEHECGFELWLNGSRTYQCENVTMDDIGSRDFVITTTTDSNTSSYSTAPYYNNYTYVIT
jgi:hypothetical protein